MLVSWKQGFNINKITAKIEHITSRDTPGKISFQGFEFKDYFSVLCNILKLHQDIPKGEKKNILWKAIVETAKAGPVDKDSIEEQLNIIVVNFLKKPIQKYVIYTSISLNPSSTLRKVKIGGVTIRFDSRGLDKFINGAQLQLKNARNLLHTDPPKNFLPVRAYISSRSPIAAFNDAFDAIDLLRGIWNLGLNQQTWIRESYGVREPINKIILGPIHTMHSVSGKIASDIWWYDPEYIKAVKTHDIVKNLSDLYQFEKKVRKSIRQLKYREKAEWALREYARALDNRSWGTAFLALWSVLEVLTHSGGDNYKVTIRRASFIFKEADLHREVLNHLRESRNDFVHSNEYSDDIEIYIYQLKRYVEALLRFHLSNGKSFANIQDVAEFLDLPIDSTTLSKKLWLYRLARRFRT
ncbi:MAG: hypothetical protein ACYDIC_11400 [Desulfobaccales bacterium]